MKITTPAAPVKLYCVVGSHADAKVQTTWLAAVLETLLPYQPGVC